jgi:hypothetical protein
MANIAVSDGPPTVGNLALGSIPQPSREFCSLIWIKAMPHSHQHHEFPAVAPVSLGVLP